MEFQGIDAARVRTLADRPARPGAYVLVWMDRSQRAHDNPALELAVARANAARLPVLVVAAIDPVAAGLSERRLRFQLEGLQETEMELRSRGIGFVLRLGRVPDVVLALAADARELVCDRAYLRQARAWRREIATRARCPVTEVEGDVVVPVEVASERQEIAARTLRPKLHRQLERFLELPEPRVVRVPAHDLAISGVVGLDQPARLARRIGGGRGLSPVSSHHRGGSSQAGARLERFVLERLPHYAADRRRIECRVGSELSMYLAIGQISPVRVFERLRRDDVAPEQAAAFIEQLVVRRELAVNFVHYQASYDDYASLPGWARATLETHRRDARPALFTDEQILAGETDDADFNAAMLEARETGSMHPTMRMYWGKRLLTWSADPRHAYERTIALNDGIFLDGHDPNSYANVGWCYGLHDRPFPERAIFGTVRSMTAAGLRRKYDPARYRHDVARLARTPARGREQG